MPLFHRKSEEERAAEESARQRTAQQQQEQSASLASLERGGIPIQAQRRLDEYRRQGGNFFTSDLSVNEFILARRAGVRPLTQVMGSSVYHVGWQYMPRGWGRFSYSQELTVISQAMNHARQLALGRMQEEAHRAGADAVVGVRIERGTYDWAADLIEFNAVGTAIKVDGAQTSGPPSLTNLSGQDFWKLHQAGYWPLGVVAASTVFYVVASWQTQRANSWWGGRQNQELGDFTQGLYVARHLAMRHVRSQAEGLRANGIVGMEIEQSEREYEVDLGNDQERTDMIFTFHAIGTAIQEVQPQLPAIYAAVNLRP
jgi:uncharacterized protein YbjQ (UPF0145 family)